MITACTGPSLVLLFNSESLLCEPQVRAIWQSGARHVLDVSAVRGAEGPDYMERCCGAMYAAADVLQSIHHEAMVLDAPL